MSIINRDKIKQKLEEQCCSKHNEHPTVSFSDDKFKISCCCDSFKEELLNIAKTESAEQYTKNVNNQIKNIFR